MSGELLLAVLDLLVYVGVCRVELAGAGEVGERVGQRPSACRAAALLNSSAASA